MFWYKLIYTVVLLTVSLGGGTIFYSFQEGWSYVDAFYFSAMTVTTIGYGDLVPTTDISKVITAVYSFFGIGIMFYLLNAIVSKSVKRNQQYFDRVFGMSKKPKKVVFEKKALRKKKKAINKSKKKRITKKR